MKDKVILAFCMKIAVIVSRRVCYFFIWLIQHTLRQLPIQFTLQLTGIIEFVPFKPISDTLQGSSHVQQPFHLFACGL